MAKPRRYEMKVHYTIDVTDPALLLDAAYARWCPKLNAVEEFTDWHKDQWQRWVDDGTSDPTDEPAWSSDRRGVDVALHEFLRPDHSLDPDIPGAIWGFAGSSCAQDVLADGSARRSVVLARSVMPSSGRFNLRSCSDEAELIRHWERFSRAKVGAT